MNNGQHVNKTSGLQTETWTEVKTLAALRVFGYNHVIKILNAFEFRRILVIITCLHYITVMCAACDFLWE